MKKLTTALLLFATLTAFGQFDETRISITATDGGYIVRDTVVNNGDTVITLRILSDSSFSSQYLASVAATFMSVADNNAKALVNNEKAKKQQAELQKLGLIGTYLQYIDGQRTISGDFRVSYNGTKVNLNAGQDENLYTQGGVRVVNLLEIASNWIRCTLITMGNEVIDLYEIRPGLWAGNGNNGLLIIQR